MYYNIKHIISGCQPKLLHFSNMTYYPTVYFFQPAFGVIAMEIVDSHG